MHQSGASVREIAAALQVGRGTLLSQTYSVRGFVRCSNWLVMVQQEERP